MRPRDGSGHKVFAKLSKDQRALKTFLTALAIVVSARTVPTLLARSRNERSEKRKTALDRTAVQIALVPTLLPRVYPYLRRQLSSGLAECLSSSILLLLPPSWRIHVVLYALSSALYHSAGTSRLRRYLPPAWTLNVVGNIVLLQAFIFNSKGFPRAYEDVIFSNSRYYVPAGMTKPELEELLGTATFSEARPDENNERPRHAYELCSRLHAGEPSCLKHYLKASILESTQTCSWVGAFSALPFVLSKQQRAILMKKPLAALLKWMLSTLRGTIFVSFSITTAWAMTCLLQRVLPKDWFRHTRWMINAAFASLWILVLPDKRRTELSLYVARLAALCAWRTWRIEGGASVPFGDVLLLALSWMQLTRLQRSGERISGLVGLAMSKIQ